ncbi:aminoglycoside phosphotransferase [Mycobacterium hodleri]|uniref:glucosamine kinase n=1 Tax=Mycolicibacterium hodleri TaxID=49897 RepID=UPI0021F31514|nr:glucosamine kinase [Mycolicibacterium hodleri]MCV7132606.1 aminoglycoside phosphotransferase [Mycolicibacterium hodleri]
MTEPLDALPLSEGRRLAVVDDGAGLAAIPQVRDDDGRWRRAQPGDGVASALLEVLAAGSVTREAFSVRSWTTRTATGERSVGVDQTNESVIVGDVAVVKWATHLQEGPHPAPRRIEVLRAAGFAGMPTPWGLLTWRTPTGADTVVAYVDDYLPDAVDGWTWAVDLVTAAVRDREPGAFAAAAADVGTVVADLHGALSGTATVASGADAARWRDGAVETLDTAVRLGHPGVVARRAEIEVLLSGLGGLAGSPVVDGHGDLHVGQVLCSRGRFVVTDFDGNPVLTAPERMLSIPAVVDVAGMTQSLAHAAIVAAKYAALDPATLAVVSAAGRTAFLEAYTRRLHELGHADLFDPTPLRAFRAQQVLREIVYAARHLPRWMYVPDAALPALLDEGTPT